MAIETIQSDDPNRGFALEVLTTSTTEFTYTKDAGDTFLVAPKIHIATHERNGSVVKILTVGDGIAIAGDVLTVTITGPDFLAHAGKTLYTIQQIINTGQRDIIMPLEIINNYD